MRRAGILQWLHMIRSCVENDTVWVRLASYLSPRRDGIPNEQKVAFDGRPRFPDHEVHQRVSHTSAYQRDGDPFVESRYRQEPSMAETLEDRAVRVEMLCDSFRPSGIA